MTSPRRFLGLTRFILSLRGHTLEEELFFAGHLRTHWNENVYLASRRIASEKAAVLTRELMSEISMECGSISDKKRFIVQLHIQRLVAERASMLVRQVLIVSAVADDQVVFLIHSDPLIGIPEFLTEISNVRLQRIRSWHNGLASDLPMILKELFITGFQAWLNIVFLYTRRLTSLTEVRSAPSVMMMQDDVISGSDHRRNLLSWTLDEHTIATYDIHIVRSRSPLFEIEESARHKLGSRLQISTHRQLFRISAENQRNSVVKQMRSSSNKFLRASLGVNKGGSRTILAITAQLMRKASTLAAFVTAKNVHVFLSQEVGTLAGDAMNVVADDLKLENIGWQYSNLNFQSSGMVPSGGIFLVFSSLYVPLFVPDDDEQVTVKVAGYPTAPTGQLLEVADQHRAVLRDVGAKRVVCYFDESIQTGKWGLVHPMDHHRRVTALARRVLEEDDFGVILKPQFARNSICRQYEKDSLLTAAFQTGRLLELVEGDFRNTVLPLEAALASDICIGHKFSATACLEAASAGVPSVLIDEYGCCSLWDEIYSEVSVVFPTLESVLDLMSGKSPRSVGSCSLGDWSPVIDLFVGSSEHTWSATIQQLVLDGFHTSS